MDWKRLVGRGALRAVDRLSLDPDKERARREQLPGWGQNLLRRLDARVDGAMEELEQRAHDKGARDPLLAPDADAAAKLIRVQRDRLRRITEPEPRQPGGPDDEGDRPVKGFQFP